MRRVLYCIGLFLLMSVSCTRERMSGEEPVVPRGQEVMLSIPFGAPGGQVLEPTKSTQSLKAENMVYNLYVFIFDMDSGGKKIYSHYFDYTNLSESGSSSRSDWWEVQNNAADDSGQAVTRGTLHLRTISKKHCVVAVIANIDAEMVNISPEQLSMVETYADLASQKATLNQLITSRSGYFPMSGTLDGVDTGQEAKWGTLLLQRLDAKIKFRVYVDLESGASSIASFQPLKWQVINIPKRAYVLERGGYAGGAFSQDDLEDAVGSDDDDYFHQGETNFETEEVTGAYYSGTTQYHKFVHGFSFYMMENRKAPKSKPLVYADRDRQQKLNPSVGADGVASVRNGDFLYANDHSTYVVITGRIGMDNTTYKTSEGATLSADVQYVVHLGDFSGDKFADFNVFRNHTYTYDIIIRDVNDIRVEVTNNYEGETLADKLAEPEPGASGNVTVALEEIFTSDAHYSSHVITFHAKHIDADKVTWVVKTPFNPSGAEPVITSTGAEVTTGIDFEWVQFRRNDIDENNQYFEDKRQIYKPMDGSANDDGLTWNVSGLVDYLKRQKRRYDAGLDNDFDSTPDSEGGPKISVTAFVNEYYYERNPITGEEDPDLWRQFVNQPMRYMYILSETQSSADGESQIIGSSFTIQQKSIQTIYNIQNERLSAAWGCEHTDDEQERGLQKYDRSGSGDRGNKSESNGRMNTLKEWALINPDGSNRILGDYTEEDAYWHHYMNLTADNETPIMLPNYRYLRYSCMSRNRDNNGNGVIDLDEVRWYMGSHNQLIGLFIGSYGIEGDARLYQRNAWERASVENTVWRQHVIASTQFSTNSSAGPYVIWGEEGLSAGSPSDSWNSGNHMDVFGTRCVRNLGHDTETGLDMTYAPLEAEPEDYVVMKRMRDGVEYDGPFDDDVYYEFDCSRVNQASLRYYTNRELASHDENSEQACLYPYFTFHSKREAVTNINSNNRIHLINRYLDSHIGENPYCPSGYRLPNVRELSVMRDFISASDRTGYLVGYAPGRTHWSFGTAGIYYDPNRRIATRYGWGAQATKVFMMEESHTFSTTRCVRDLKPSETSF